MTPGTVPSTKLGSFLSGRLVVVGRAPEVTASSEWLVDRFGAGMLDEISPSAPAIVVDLRDVSIEELALWRQRTTIASPLVLLHDPRAEPLHASTIDLVGADDVILLPAEEGSLVRRVRIAIDLGRTRLALSFADQALRESVNGLSIADASLKGAPLVDVSEVFERMTQYSRAEILGQSCNFLQRGDRTQTGITELRAALRGRDRITSLVRNYKKDGTMFWNEVTLFPVLAHGTPTRWVAGVQHDVTQLVDARAQVGDLYRRLVEQRAFDPAILDGVQVGIITADHGGRVTFANRAAKVLLRLDAGAPTVDVVELLGLDASPDELLGDERRRLFAHEYVREGIEHDFELLLSRGDDAGDSRTGFFFIFRDVREEKQRQAEHRRFERLAAMGTMVAGFAHEVRNPVAALRSIAEELGEELTQAGLMLPHAGRMLRVLERMERLVRTSLRFGRPAVPQCGVHKPWILCSAAIAGVAPRTLAANQEIAIEMEADIPNVYVDDGQIVQALVILLENALDAAGAPEGVLVRVSRSQKTDVDSRPRKSTPPSAPNHVRLEVIDLGPGIASADLSRIFDPFFTTKASGTGLGLSIAQQIVVENSGRLEVSSSRGSPTTFAIIVPAVEE